MEKSPGAESDFDRQPDPQDLGEPLNPSFCQDVFSRQLSPVELDNSNYNLDLDKLGLDFDATIAKIRSYQNWDVFVVEDEADTLRMKLAVAMCHGRSGKTIQVLFLRQDASSRWE